MPRPAPRIDWTRPPRLAERAIVTPGPLQAVIIQEGVPRCPDAATAREEAIALLQVAAEVEHALLVQYLYAWLSVDQGATLPARRWRTTLREVAIQEMGHLITVQNLLLAIGGGLHFERENVSLHTGVHPFPFQLEPLSRMSLAKYVAAEQPALAEDDPLREEVDRIHADAKLEAGGQVHRVGILYAMLYWLFKKQDAITPDEPWQDFPLDDAFPPDYHLADTDFAAPEQREERETVAEEWPGATEEVEDVFVLRGVPRDRALRALFDIAAQGEGLQAVEANHFTRFLNAYREATTNPNPTGINPVAVNPTLAATPPAMSTPITEPTTRLWAELFDLHYYLLLLETGLALLLPRTGDDGARRGQLAEWAVNHEMRVAVRRIGQLLSRLPLEPTPAGAPVTQTAGAPFSTPDEYLPEEAPARWRMFLRIVDQAQQVIGHIQTEDPNQQQLLSDLSGQLEEKHAFALQVLDELTSDEPGGPPPGNDTMTKIYRIHPAIGIARLGGNDGTFFVGPELPGGPSVELQPDGTEIPLTQYKSDGRIKRQAARFRVFEYERDPSGTLGPGRELTADEATIEWEVKLANRKAASRAFNGSQMRNPNDPPEQLIIAPELPSISGPNAHQTATTSGRFKGKEVFLGELRTDSKGRLLVLGGHGTSGSVPPGRPITNFANNAGWHDDTADGSVTARITFPGQAAREVDTPAWVIVAPPDFAPGIQGLITLYDVAFQAAVERGWLTPPPRPSFRKHIFPILRRAASLRWVNQFGHWNSFPRDWERLSNNQPEEAQFRQETYELLLDVEESEVLNDLKYTKTQHALLKAWRDGNFEADWNAPPEPPSITPEGLDRAALEATVGGGFFPGIEAGIVMTNAQLYAEPFRLTRQPFPLDGGQATLEPGALTARMAVPWQADFFKCAGAWWPAQRPDTVMLDPNAQQPNADWDGGISNHQSLIQNVFRLGVVVPATNAAGKEVFVERERDESFPRP